MPDQLLRSVCRPLFIRVVTAVTTDLCREAATRHGVSPAAACALGRGLTAALLLSTLTKGGERVTVQIVCDGPLRGLTADAYDDGDVRGYVTDPHAWAGRPLSGRQRLSGLLGPGVLSVIREMGLNDRYQGQVRIATGEVDEDVEAYLRNSEQVPSALGCEVLLGEDGQVQAAAGFLAQVMPSGRVDLIREAQHRLRTGALYDLLAAGPDPDQLPLTLAEALLPGLKSDGESAPIEPLDTRALRFRCRCSAARIEAMLATLGATDLDEMIAEGQAEITCNFCGERYVVDRDTLLRIRTQRTPMENN